MTETYTHGHHESVLRSHRWRTARNSAAFLLPHLTSGTTVLDVGCGPGTITIDLARLVTPGRVTGIDADGDVLNAAREEATRQNVSNVTFQVGSVYELGDRAFDVVHAHQVLQHLSDPVAALREMGRVAGEHGLVAVRDADYAAMSWYPDSPTLDRWRELVREVTLANGGQPDAGRRLPAWARSAGFGRIEAGASVWCFAKPEDRRWWAGSWAERVVASSLAETGVRLGLASRAELEAMATAWQEWADHPDGWFAVVHGEVLARR
ncbi:MAG: class I SAM-dependent methyltransferase [Acidimicrobiia bacterium]|jgi:SAM-dependent methyltransferase